MKNTENFLSQSLEIEGKMEGKNGGCYIWDRF